MVYQHNFYHHCSQKNNAFSKNEVFVMLPSRPFRRIIKWNTIWQLVADYFDNKSIDVGHFNLGLIRCKW